MTPAPQSPKCQGPGGPGKPKQQTPQTTPFSPAGLGQFDPPTPQIQRSGHKSHQQGRQCNDSSPQNMMAFSPGFSVVVQQMNDAAAEAEQNGEGRCTRQGQSCQSQHRTDRRDDCAVG